jgi:predicted ATPase
MRERTAGLTHANTLALGTMHATAFELMRGDRRRIRTSALELAHIAREHDLRLFRAFDEFFGGWMAADDGALAGGIERMRRGAENLRVQNALVFDGLLKIALSEAEARAGDLERAVATLDEALATTERAGFRAFEAELHRVRGEILLKRDPSTPAVAEDAFRAAIGVTREQRARSFALRAALSLARLYQSTGRTVEAHAVLAPALEGFSPTPEMPEIAEAEAVLAALVDTEEVRAEAAQRQRRLHLQVAYGNALIAARGYGAPETTEAFARARDWADGDKDAAERLAVDYGLWVGSYVRGELPPMRAHAETFLNDVAETPDSPEAGVAHRIAGVTHWFAGEFVEARDELERALALFQPGRDDELAFRFGHDAGVCGMAYLAHASWALGDIGRAVSVFERMQSRIEPVQHAGSRALGAAESAIFDLMRGGHTRAAPNIFELARLARKHGLTLFLTVAEFLEGWVNEGSGMPGGLETMRRAAELLKERGILIFDGLLKIGLARAEARAGDRARAVAITDEALATCDHLGYRAYEAELHRTRGELLLERDPANPAPAEEAFRTALAVAGRQGARSFGLRAALALAKLYQSTGRPANAHAVLAPALEGFSPTPEMLEIAEAQALLATVGVTP